MALLWTKEMEKKYMMSRKERRAWELLHEEEGFEDLGAMYDAELDDIDGQETHIEKPHEAKPKE